MKKLILLQKCGLGNQLFQYIAAMYFAKKYSAQLEVVREARMQVSQIKFNPFLLQHFSISAPVRDLTAKDRLLCSTAASKALLANASRGLMRTQVVRQHFSTDWTFVPDLPIDRGIQTVYLDGFFQVHTYASALEEIARKEFAFREPATGTNLAVLEQIRSAEAPVSLHIRRGDYTVIYGGKNVLPLSFYNNSIRTIHERVDNPVFFVFSDDIAWAREHLPKNEKMIFVDHNGDETAYEDMRLMSATKHHIIANSTFSWWGTWLNPDPNKIVCAPTRWLDPKIAITDLLPDAWLRIPVEEGVPQSVAVA